MSSLWSRLRTPTAARSMSFDEWMGLFSFNGHQYPLGMKTTMHGSRPVEIAENFEGYINGIHKRSGPVAAAVAARAFLISQIRFRWRNEADGPTGKLFGDQALAPLEGAGRPSLLHLAETHVSYGGTAYFHRRIDDQVRLLRPDWVKVLLGSNTAPDIPAWQLDADVVGFLYSPGGDPKATQFIGASEVSRWTPEPDPLNPWRGESWVTSVIREITTDGQATDHVSKFYENAATPQIVFSLDPTVTYDKLKEFAAMVRDEHAGVENAYKNLVIGGGADVTVVGSDLQQLNYRDNQGGHETRVASRSRVPAVVLGIREGMQGSALNSGNYAQTRRLWADGWFNPAADSLCAALEPLLDKPSGPVELTFDPARIPFLQEDRKDEADILATRAAAMRQLFDGGWQPDSIVEATITGDLTKLKHEGRASVQTQPDPAPAKPKALPAPADAA